MKKDFLISLFLLFSLLIFSSCSTGLNFGGSNTNYAKEIRSGNGLQITFNLDDKLIKSGKLKYEISFNNNGKDKIILNRENFKLSVDTTETVFTSESFDEFYKNILDGGSLTLYRGQDIKKSGILLFDENFLKERVLPDFKVFLDINYNYKTEFNNNLQIDFSSGIGELKTLDTVSQAAPVQIRSIKLEAGFRDKYNLEYEFNNVGQIGNLFAKEIVIDINNFNVKLGTNDISSNCVPVYRKGGYDTKIESGLYRINDNLGTLIAKCSITFSNDLGSSYTTKTEGSFDYNYKMRFENPISIS